MADLAGNNPITTPGDYDVATIPGQEYLLCMKGESYSLQVQFYDQNLDGFSPIDNGAFPGSSQETEARIVAPSSTLRFSVDSEGVSGGISVTLVPIK